MKLEAGWGCHTTETFRWASYKSPHGYGLNAQTNPKHFRYYLEPPPGRVFAQGDLSQAESRVVAYTARCKDLIEIFADPSRHLHLENALAVFGHSVEKDTPEYVLAKMIVHASSYRMGPHKFSVSAGLPVSQTKILMTNFHRARPEIHRWHDEVWQKVKNFGKLTTPLGVERTFYEALSCFSVTGKMSDQHWGDAIAWVPQTTVPHVLDLGMLQMLSARDEGMDLWFHHQGHDSFLVSLPDDATCQREFAELAVKIYAGIDLVAAGGKFVIPMELGLGYSMGDNLEWRGEPITRSQWQATVDKKLQKKSREEQILDGVYGVHLKGYRA